MLYQNSNNPNKEALSLTNLEDKTGTNEKECNDLKVMIFTLRPTEKIPI